MISCQAEVFGSVLFCFTVSVHVLIFLCCHTNTVVVNGATLWIKNSPYENCWQCNLWLLSRVIGILSLERHITISHTSSMVPGTAMAFDLSNTPNRNISKSVVKMVMKFGSAIHVPLYSIPATGAANNNYCHYGIICWLFSWWIFENLWKLSNTVS